MLLVMRRGGWCPLPDTSQRPVNASLVLGVGTRVQPWPKDLYLTGGAGDTNSNLTTLIKEEVPTALHASTCCAQKPTRDEALF